VGGLARSGRRDRQDLPRRGSAPRTWRSPRRRTALVTSHIPVSRRHGRTSRGARTFPEIASAPACGGFDATQHDQTRRGSFATGIRTPSGSPSRPRASCTATQHGRDLAQNWSKLSRSSRAPRNPRGVLASSRRGTITAGRTVYHDAELGHCCARARVRPRPVLHGQEGAPGGVSGALGPGRFAVSPAPVITRAVSAGFVPR